LPCVSCQREVPVPFFNTEGLGFRLLRKSKGSHWQFTHPDGRRTTVPVHAGREIGPGLLRKILRDIGLTPQELRDRL